MNFLLKLIILSTSLLIADTIKAESLCDTYQWTNHPAYPFAAISYDSTLTRKGLYLETMGDRKGIVSTLIPFFQEDGEDSDIILRLKYKTKNYGKMYAIISSIGACETIIRKDTIRLLPVEKWTEINTIIHPRNAYLLNISIVVTGRNGRNSKVWIDDYDLFVKGQKLTNTTKKRTHSFSLSENDIILWNMQNLSQLPFLRKKILALGETVHGTKTMSNIAIALFKERITKHQCKIIAMEIPLEFAFYINRYVKNDPNFLLADISQFFENTLFPDVIVDFIEWVKKYNSQHGNSISFMGFDINPIIQGSQVHLFDFFNTLNKGKDLIELDTLGKLVLENKMPLSSIITTLEASTAAKDVLTDEELIMMKFCFKEVLQEKSSYKRFINRDKTMSQTIAFMTDHLLKQDEQITLFAHFSHTNYTTNQDMIAMDYLSAGYNLKNRYQDNYSCIALATNQGTAMLSINDRTMQNTNLPQAPPESIEYQLNKLNIHFGYLSMDKLQCSDMLRVRLIGNKYYLNSFRYMTLKARIDGLLFIKEVVCSPKRRDTLKKIANSSIVTMEAYMKALEKVKNKL